MRGSLPRQGAKSNPMIKDYLKKFYFREEGKELILTLEECIKLIQNYEQSREAGLQERIIKFRERVIDFNNQYYTRELKEEFIDYWTEHNESGHTLRFEMKKNQPFNIGRRLSTWAKNQRNGKYNKTDNLTRLRSAISNHRNERGGNSLF